MGRQKRMRALQGFSSRLKMPYRDRSAASVERVLGSEREMPGWPPLLCRSLQREGEGGRGTDRDTREGGWRRGDRERGGREKRAGETASSGAVLIPSSHNVKALALMVAVDLLLAAQCCAPPRISRPLTASRSHLPLIQNKCMEAPAHGHDKNTPPAWAPALQPLPACLIAHSCTMFPAPSHVTALLLGSVQEVDVALG